MKTISTVCVLTLASLCGTASAQNVQTRTDSCARLGTFVNIALSQVKTHAIPLRSTYVYRKIAVNTPLADQLSKAENMMRAEQKSPDAVAVELQSECEKASPRMAMFTQNTTTVTQAD